MTQDDFDKLIEDYNEDYHHLLWRASKGNDDALLPAFLRVKKLYDAIVEFQGLKNYLFRILPYPISFRTDDDLLRSRGFDDKQIKNIRHFFEYVKETQGRAFGKSLKKVA